LFKHSVVATSFSGDSQKIVNDGLPPQKVASATGTQVRRVAIREAPVTVRNLGGAEHFDANARTVTIYRPNFVASSSVSTKGFGSSLTPKAPATLGSTVTTVPARVTSNHDEPGTVSAGPSASQPSARSPQSAPLILRGPQPSGVRETPPARSLVVIGRKDPNGTQTTYRTMLPSAASREAPVATAAEPARTSSGLAAPSATPWAENNVVRETPNPIWQQSPAMNPGYRPPVYVPRNNNNPIYGYERPGNSYRPVTPAYQPPARSAPAEVPRYTPPAANNNVQRSYSPPPAAAPPAPAAPSAPSQSGSGGRNQR